MRKHVSAAVLITVLAFAAPASARSNFQSTVDAPLTGAVKVEVVISDELAYRAENLPRTLKERGSSSSRFSKGFGKNGNYGTRDVERLKTRLEKKVTAQFTRKGITLSDSAPTVLRVTLTSAKPNRPTFNQLTKESGLSYRSYGLGGAEIEAELLAAGGQSLGNMQHRFYEDDIRDAAHRGTWSDAYRSFDLFARKAAKQLAS